MRVLVTGHTGYIGAVLTPMLLNRGHDIVGLDSDIFVRCPRFGTLVQVPALVKDVRDVALGDLKGFDAVVHLAGLSNDPLGDFQPQITLEINYQATVKLAKLAKEAKVPRFLYASSCSIYGESNNEFLDEFACARPVTPYGVSKAKAEQALRPLADRAFSPVFVRASTAYGFSPSMRFDLVVNNLTAWATTTGMVHLKSDGSAWRPIVHVEDIARAYMALLEADPEVTHNQAFNVGTTPENYKIRDIAEVVRETIPGCRIEFAVDAGTDRRCYRVDCNQICRSIVAYKPQWTLLRGVKQLYDAYTDIGLTSRDYEGERPKGIAHVLGLVRDGILDMDLRRAEYAKPLETAPS